MRHRPRLDTCCGSTNSSRYVYVTHLTYMHTLRLTWSLNLMNQYREIVLGRVAGLVKAFVKKVSIMRGFTEAAAEAAGGKIFTFGSYRLGVHGPGSDIDTLAVVPKHITREDFFDIFEHMLREMDGVTEVSVRTTLASISFHFYRLSYLNYLRVFLKPMSPLSDARSPVYLWIFLWRASNSPSFQTIYHYKTTIFFAISTTIPFAV